MKEAREEEDRLINKQALKVQRSQQKMEKNYLSYYNLENPWEYFLQNASL